MLGKYYPLKLSSHPLTFRPLVQWLEDDSPYPEVRSAVANFDDPLMPAATVRAWVLGIIWAILLPGMNQFFYFRYPSVSIGGVSSAFVSTLPVFADWDPSITVI